MAGVRRPQDLERISRTIHVGGVVGLGDEIREHDLADFFSQHGEVTAVRISGRFAWVEFADVRAANAALQLDGHNTGGHHLRVSQSKSAIHSNGLKKRQLENLWPLPAAYGAMQQYYPQYWQHGAYPGYDQMSAYTESYNYFPPGYYGQYQPYAGYPHQFFQMYAYPGQQQWPYYPGAMSNVPPAQAQYSHQNFPQHLAHQPPPPPAQPQQQDLQPAQPQPHPEASHLTEGQHSVSSSQQPRQDQQQPSHDAWRNWYQQERGEHSSAYPQTSHDADEQVERSQNEQGVSDARETIVHSERVSSSTGSKRKKDGDVNQDPDGADEEERSGKAARRFHADQEDDGDQEEKEQEDESEGSEEGSAEAEQTSGGCKEDGGIPKNTGDAANPTEED